MAAPQKWLDEDEADIVRTERALDRLLFPRRAPVNAEHARTIRFQRESCVRGIGADARVEGAVDGV